MDTRWSRRTLVQAMGATALAAAAAPPALGAPDPRRVPRAGWDAIVVGAGTTGLPLAIFAARRGGKVLLLDIAGETGGTLHVSTGQMSAAGTALQRARGIADTPQEHYDDLQRISRGTIDPAISRLAVFNAADTFDWLVSRGFQTLPGHPVSGEAHEPYSKPRYYWASQGGRSIMQLLQREVQAPVERGQVSILLKHDVFELLQARDGAVRGVRARDDAGATREFTGRSVVLATGGYAADPATYQRITGRPQYIDMPYRHSRGRGLELGLAAGGRMRGLENYMANYGLVLTSDDHPASLFARPQDFPQKRPPWEIHVNAEGRRFVREDVPSVDAREQSLLYQTGGRRWIVFDQAILDAAPPVLQGLSTEDLREAFDAHPWFKRADSLAGLARAAGIDAKGLQDTVTMYNYGVRTGQDPLGRQHHPLPIAKPPFHSIKTQATTVTSAAGLAVDESLRVVREDGSAIPGLYAAGELLGAGALQGKAYSGGMMVTPSLTFGRLLGSRILPV
ncbi:MAG: FAD-dependent oxidoreductase [Steroidobacteraceae bacterium]|nr:FAD-dependent oxidoreductase [Steroidobacteraceae bacterium]